MHPLTNVPPLIAAAAPPSTDASTIATVWDLTWRGGPVMVPIALCSLVALALVIERAIALRPSRTIPADFVAATRAALKQGTEQALAMCRAHPSPVARIFETALARWDRDPEQVEKRIVEAGLREAALLRKHLRTLSMIAAVAPLLGLLGTIFGMIKAFRTVSMTPEALGRTELLAGGIYEAMVTTAAGLVVAIPVVLAYHWLSSRVDRLVLDMDRTCIDLAEDRVLADQPSRREPQLAA